ncbi:MAG: branched-chain amino acid ABC transporter permease [Oscillospiraceae bacterium]
MKMKTAILKNKSFVITLLVSLAALIIIPLFIRREFAINVLILCCIWGIMGIGWNFIGGYAGQVSNGHALFYAVGAYTGGLCMNWFQMTPWISMWIGVAISVLIAFVLGIPLLRLRGHYFAIATMALVECARIIFLNWEWIGGATGISFQRLDLPQWYTWQFVAKHPFYYLCLAFLVVFLVLSKIMENSKFGYYCRAIRANQESAESTGVNAARYKRIAYMISAGIVSIGGALYAQYIQYLDPTVLLPLANSMLIVLVCVMGGIGTVWGPVLGAFVMTMINEYSRSNFARISGLNLVIYGVLVIIIVLFLPDGLISLVKRLNPKNRFKKSAVSATSANGKEG